MFIHVHTFYTDGMDNSLKMEDNGEYDYVVDGRGSLPVNSSSMTAPGGPVYQGADPYHSLGPDVSKKGTSSISNKQRSPQSAVSGAMHCNHVLGSCYYDV